MLWDVSQGSVRLSLVQIFPVHQDAAQCGAFSSDNQTLLTCGECCVKLWDVSSYSLAIEHGSIGQEEAQLEQERRNWERAIPSGFSVDRSLELLAFDDTLTALVPNLDWIYPPGTNAFDSRLEHHSDRDISNGRIASIFAFAAVSKQEPQPMDDIKTDSPGVNDRLGNRLHNSESLAESQTPLRSEAAATTTDSAAEERSADPSAASVSLLDKWEQDLQRMESFDFEQLLNPAASRAVKPGSSTTPLRINADAQLLREFSKKTTVRF